MKSFWKVLLTVIMASAPGIELAQAQQIFPFDHKYHLRRPAATGSIRGQDHCPLPDSRQGERRDDYEYQRGLREIEPFHNWF
jgi:hypothetical protein